MITHTEAEYSADVRHYFPEQFEAPEPLQAPLTNSYQITLTLLDVGKSDAFGAAEKIRTLLGHELPDSSLVVQVAHVKGLAADA